MAKPVAPRKPIFIPGAFDDLRAAAGGEASSAPLRVLLADVDEDPDQPRTMFDEAKLRQLADTIELLGGVLQPIGVRAAVDGRYRLVFGARRLRASRMLGVADIPAIIVADEQASLAAQVVENQSRADLSNSDLAAVVARLTEQGVKGKQIATICGLTDYDVTMFRSVSRLPPFLAERLDEVDMRAIYELFTAWRQHPAKIEDALTGHGQTLSVTEARRIIGAATGKATGSLYLADKTAGPPHSAEAAEVVRADPALVQPTSGQSEPPHSAEVVRLTPSPSQTAPRRSEAPHSAEAPRAAPATRTAGAPVFFVALPDGRRGTLVTTEGTGSTGDTGTVLVDVQGERIEAAFVELRPVSVG